MAVANSCVNAAGGIGRSGAAHSHCDDMKHAANFSLIASGALTAAKRARLARTGSQPSRNSGTASAVVAPANRNPRCSHEALPDHSCRLLAFSRTPMASSMRRVARSALSSSPAWSTAPTCTLRLRSSTKSQASTAAAFLTKSGHGDKSTANTVGLSGSPGGIPATGCNPAANSPATWQIRLPAQAPRRKYCTTSVGVPW
mmetsp:Transcript_79638/g.258088  ORF Transcript_79638/g.258088 Transcript_79638/m.258088 type:complete len:200 (+) Transcript_79638:1004-1603(+)